MEPKVDDNNDTASIEEEHDPNVSRVLYTASPEVLNSNPPITLEVISRVCKVTIFHWSFGIILIPIFKTFFGLSLGFGSFIFTLCISQVFLSILIKGLWSLLSEKQPKEKVIKGWSNHTVVITGGSSGLGLLLAQSLAMKRASVAILDIKKPSSNDMGFYFYECDVGNPKAVAEAMKEIKEELGVPTILINNAAINRSTLLTTSNVTDIEKTIRVNMMGPIWTTKLVLPWMIEEDWGHIVNISSVLGLASPSSISSYSASKAGLISFHDSLHQEITSVHKKNIKTTLVIPGHMKTELFDNIDDPPYPWLFPEVDPLEVVFGIIHNLEYHMSGELYYPHYAYLAPFFRLCPLSVRNFVMNKIGANQDIISWHNSLKKEPKSNKDKPAPVPSVVFSDFAS